MLWLGIVAETTVRRERIARSIDKTSEFSPMLYTKTEQLVADFRLQKIEGLVFDLKNFAQGHLRMLGQIKERAPLLPIAVVCDEISSPMLRRVDEITERHTDLIVIRQSDIRDLPGILRKMVQRQGVKMRKHTRYGADTDVELGFSFLGYMRGKVMNLSRGGALLQFSEPPKGEVFNLRVLLRQPQKIHSFLVQKCWQKTHALANGASASLVGVRFLD